jgi:hypothetical protein
MTVGLYHPTLGIPRADCPTMSVSIIYVITSAVTLLLMLLGHPATMAIEVPLTVLASVRALLAFDTSMATTALRAMVAMTGSPQGGVSA